MTETNDHILLLGIWLVLEIKADIKLVSDDLTTKTNTRANWFHFIKREMRAKFLSQN